MNLSRAAPRSAAGSVTGSWQAKSRRRRRPARRRRGAAGHQRRLGRSPRGRRRGPGGGAARRGRPRPACSRRRAPTSATSRLGARWKSSARSRWAKASGCWIGGVGRRGAERRPPALRSARSPVSAARRSRPRAAALLPEGIGWSPTSLRRAISSSWSAEVEKKPPRSGSPKRSIIVSASSRAASNQRALEARLVEGEQRLEQEGVVLEVGVEAGVAVLVGAQQAAVGVAHRAEHELGALARRRRGSRRGRARRRPRRGRRSPARSRRSGACRRGPARPASARAS